MSATYLARWAIWVLGSLPAWLLFGLVGGLAPIWQFLLVAAVLGAVDIAVAGERRWPTPLLAALLPTAPALLAFEPPSAGWLTGLALAGAVVGFALAQLDRLPGAAARLGLVPVAAALGLVALLLVSSLLPRSENPIVPLSRIFTLHVMVMPAAVPAEERLVLENGAVAWFNPATRSGPVGAAAFFHGADAQGSAQPTAVVARRALLNAGYAVIAVDHPGYGESPVPDLVDVTSWDPLPTNEAALDRLAGRSGGQPVLLIGHSMGAADVMRLLGNGVRPQAAVIMGGGAIDPLPSPDDPDSRAPRMLSDRGLPEGALDTATIAAIQSAYYDNAALARAVPDDAAPLHLVHFGVEWADVTQARELLRSLLPPQSAVHVFAGVGHYLDSRRRAPVVLTNARAYAAALEFFKNLR
jgi:alpha-beta hydrolase superfamily lysophospholipase